MAEKSGDPTLGHAERDLLTLGIAIAAIILFVGTGGSVLPAAIDAVFFGGKGPDDLLVNALLLNIALIIFGWRRYRELKQEIKDRRKAEELARKLSEVDPLTGCLNRRSMTNATEVLRASARAKGDAIAYCMIDLDNFKQINDMHGHSVGDKMLVELTNRIKSILPENAVLARLGGDEFAFVISYDPAARERIDDLVIRLYERTLLPFSLDGLTLDATVSVGIATDHTDIRKSDEDGATDRLMQRADIAMYQAKKQGKNRFFWFEASMESELRFRHELEAGIRAGLRNGEFVPFYEQQIDLKTDEIVGFEMLARWHSETLGSIGPDIFIPIAEEIGAISELSELLIKQALKDASEWDEALTLAINVSPVQLRDPWFAQKLLKLMLKHKFPPHRLEVEITESCLHENVGIVHSTITSLRNQGVRISLDDFGTGYSSLEQLRALPFDRLKIDKSFIAELSDPECDDKIVDAIISLASGLNMPLTAEGIENEDILESLKSMGDFKGQGYHFGRPEDAEKVRERLAKCGKLAQREESASPIAGAPPTPRAKSVANC